MGAATPRHPGQPALLPALVPALLLLALLAACGGPDSPRPAEPTASAGSDAPSGPTGPTGPTTTDRPAPSPSVDLAADEARDRLVSADTGVLQTTVDDIQFQFQRDGVYRLSDGASRTLTVLRPGRGEAPYELATVLVDESVYAQFRFPGLVTMRRCWLRSTPDVLATRAEAVPLGRLLLDPPELTVLASAQGRAGAVVASLAGVVPLLGIELAETAGAPVPPRARVPLMLAENGTEVEWSTTLADLVETAEAAGLPVQPGLTVSVPTTIEVELSGLGDPVDITAPAADLVVDAGEGVTAGVLATVEGCESAGEPSG